MWRTFRRHRMGRSLLRRVANSFHRDIVRKPKALAENDGHELVMEFRFVLADYLTRKPRPFFLQVGGFDGVTCDPLYETVCRQRLPGIILEPQRWAFERLRQAYADQPQVTLVNAALGPRDGQETLYKIRDDVDAPHALRGLASFDEAVILKHRKRWPSLVEALCAEAVATISFATLFRKYGLPAVDILQIDTEGFDYEVLKLFDVLIRKPPVVHFEHKHLSKSDLNEALALLIRGRYRIAVGSVNTVAYLSNGG